MSNSPENKLTQFGTPKRDDQILSIYHNKINILKKQNQDLLNSNSLLKEDIKRKQRAEQVLLTTKVRLRNLLSSSPCVIYSRQIIDPFGITFVSNSIQKFGYQPHDFLQEEESWKIYIHRVDLDNLLSELSSIITNQEQISEYRFLQKDGTYCWIQDQRKLVYDNMGKPIEIIGSWQNISERKKFEEELFQEKELAQTTLQSIAEAVITTDRYGKIEYLNPVAENITGWILSEVKGIGFRKVFNTSSVKSSLDNSEPELEDVLNTGITISRECILIAQNKQKYSINKSIAPIRNKDEEIIGTVIIFQDITEKRKLSAQLFWQASHDSLTGLMNRTYFEKQLQEVLSNTQTKNNNYSLLYLDLDRFKIVNDTCGHQAGDELLRQLGEILKEQIRPQDLIARLGGDEFGILLKESSSEFAQTFAEKILTTVEKFVFLWNDNSFHVGVSIGLITITPHLAVEKNILSLVDNACYVAKNNGRNCVYNYSLDDQKLVEERKQTEWTIKINQALKENRFCLYKQSIISLSDHTGNSHKHYEILLRMIDKNGQKIPPMSFLPSAERYGLMPEIDRWVIKSFCSSAKDLDLTNYNFVTINLSGASINDESFFSFLQEQINIHNIPAHKLCFEITETVAIANLSTAKKLINKLKQIGCFIALDDFGSGMSSFGYLKNLPCDYLKIDGNFVKDIVNDPIDEVMVDCINRMAKVIGIKTIAEYVENKAIIDKLQKLAVDYGQGYGISIPEPLL